MSTIFVQIASYRDPQLPTTIDQMLERADNPDQFTFGICWQYDETENINKYDNRQNFKIKKYHYSESEGLGWARAISNSLYNGEELTLQLDSHHRFAKGWDTMMLEDYKQACTMSDKPILSTYLTPFEAEKENELDPGPCLMSQYEFSSDKLLMSRPYYIENYKEHKRVIRARTISGHFYLVQGNFINEVPYDPDIYFGGYVEETTLSVRAFTHGYDIFSPYRQYIWHEYTRNNRPKHWDDHGKGSSTKKSSGERDVYARKKTRQLFGQEDYKIEFGKYGLGSKRSLYDYEIYGGFDFKKCRIQDYTLNVKEPPNPSNWKDQFISKKYNINCTWDVEFFKKYNFDKPKVLTLGIQNSSGSELYRKDFLPKTDQGYIDLCIDTFNVDFYSIDKPDKIVMYLLNDDGTWSDRYEKQI